ncbi:MAG: bifunctional DNA-formamidopyrimidine glycosylase/DNA-(apurinic or apyrimidinic site) lyase [Acidobacteria bacterium]|nr:bifunctional DNA-formamidopyrimidine glycosylase/DNA-(apurinic or apyrimidinic site) lyase [Acidobacteriota bacterium]
MPELPEVETIVRGLRPRVVGRRIENAEFRWARTAKGDADLTTAGLLGQRITALRRWGKYIVFDLEREGAASVLVVHLRMTGNFLINGEPGPWTRAILTLDGGVSLVFHDIRKFGRFEWAPEIPPRLRELGPEPLEVGLEEFRQRLKARSAQVKAVLLDQEFLRGLGNIYCDEALFRSGIHPRANTARIGPKRAARLHQAIQEVLRDAIEQGGTTVMNYVNSEGTQGYFQLKTFVYGKTGESCKVCGGRISRTAIGGRTTHYCGKCQRG